MRASEYEPFINDKKEWISDKYFTQQRLAGVNPMSLRRVTFHDALIKGQWFSLPARVLARLVDPLVLINLTIFVEGEVNIVELNPRDEVEGIIQQY